MAENFNRKFDADLYEMCLRGDESAWKYVFNFVLTITKFARMKLKQEPDDIAQIVVISLIEGGIKKVKNKNSFRAFIKKITANRIIDISRGAYEKRESSLDNPVENDEGNEMAPIHQTENPSPEDEVINKKMIEVVETALKSLPENCSKTLKEYFRYKMGFYEDYRELTKVLGKPVGTVSVQVRRCLSKLIENEKIKDLL